MDVGDTFSKKDTYTFDDPCYGCDGTFTIHLGSGLELVDEDTQGCVSTFTFDAATDVGIIDDDDGEIPVTEEEGYGDDCTDRIYDHRANLEYQSVEVERSWGDISFDVDADDDDVTYYHPPACGDSTYNDFGDETDALGTAFSALGLATSSGVLSAAGLAAGLVSTGNEYSPDRVYMAEAYGSYGFFRGGNHVRFTIIADDDGAGCNSDSEDSGKITLTQRVEASDFNGAVETSYDIFVDPNGVSVY